MEPKEKNNIYDLVNLGDIAKINFETFIEHARTKMPRVFDTDDIELTPRDNCSEVYISLHKQWMIADLVDELAAKMGVNILYAICKSGGKFYKVVGYSMPYIDEMYVIQIISRQHGMTEGFYMAFYDSLDIMFQDIKDYFFEMDKSSEVLERINPRELFKHFN